MHHYIPFIKWSHIFLDGAQLDRQDIEIVEGDIAFPKGTMPHTENRNAYGKAAKWANGIIPYQIDRFSTYSAGQINTITASMRKLEQQTNNCIKFVQRTSQPTWIEAFV
ncbi:unnamed protein product [Didymodactylos carnosus]|uniref:Peptidase M12A domain-containing protein n=1 Tax=Didymodactylos carnosus TaxID=1234261 RepID=A0A813REN3_9BILA|nr:unnamed protein product [Didymodactylos carnosus]CAF3562945.1 unnamed protein product [Didymodactylos carnosus]